MDGAELYEAEKEEEGGTTGTLGNVRKPKKGILHDLGYQRGNKNSNFVHQHPTADCGKRVHQIPQNYIQVSFRHEESTGLQKFNF